MARRKRLEDAWLYGIVDFGYVAAEEIAKITQDLLTGGADVLQLRAKGVELETVAAAAREMIPLCKAAGVPFILNDYPEMAVALGADGVHVGQEDGMLKEVRNIVGAEILIGRSTHSLEQAQAALDEGADYIGYGPLFPTPTKAGRTAIGLHGVRRMEDQVGRHLPAFCIGGIRPENLDQVIAAGARRCVVVSYLLTAEDVAAAASELKDKLR
ncbi:MAG: thiamine phosphate synthase [Armatimonadetes bacterium]|nr:thiamine phosphate synthase [Akkermansiaceae bacterium]